MPDKHSTWRCSIRSVTLLINAGSNYLNAGEYSGTLGENAHPSIVPYQDVFGARDWRHFVATVGPMRFGYVFFVCCRRNRFAEV